MDNSNLKYKIEVDNEISSSVVNINEKCTSSLLKDSLTINFSFKDDVLGVSIKNNSSKTVGLNNFTLELFSSTNYKEAFCIINPKKANEKVTYMPMCKVKDNESSESQLFEIFVDEESHSSNMYGFLGCQFSRNYIENVINKGELKISAVYNFINQELFPDEEFVLDSIYIKEGRNIFSLFNGFVDKVLGGFDIREDYNKKLILRKSNGYSILYTYKVNGSTLKINNKPVHVKVDGKKLYAVDISKPEGKKKIFANANAVLSRANALNLDGVGEYIGIIQKNKLFNANYELSKLLASIKDEFQGIRLYSDDYPLGLFDENVIVDNKELVLEDKKSLLKRLINRKSSHHINYDFYIKILMQRLVTYYNENFSVNSKKISELMSVVLGGNNISSLRSDELIEMNEDLDTRHAIIPFIEKKKAFALLLTGRKYVYLAVFNLEKESVKFYCDLTVHSGYRDLDGVATEIYSNTNYLISEGKLYIRNLPSMDCCLFKKAIDYQMSNTAEV
jgi:hypothetical protein